MCADVRKNDESSGRPVVRHATLSNGLRRNKLALIVASSSEVRLLDDVFAREGFTTAHLQPDMVQKHDLHDYHAVIVDGCACAADLSRILENLANRFPTVPRFVILDDSDVRRVVDVMRTGIADVIVKPVDLVDLVDRVHAGHRQSLGLRDGLPEDVLRSLYGFVDQLAHSDNLEGGLRLMAQTVKAHTGAREVCLLLGDGYGMNGRWVTTELNTCTAFLKLKSGAAHLESPRLGAVKHIGDLLELPDAYADWSTLVMPLRADAQHVGTLIAFHEAGVDFSEDDRRLITIIADRGVAAVHHLNLTTSLNGPLRVQPRHSSLRWKKKIDILPAIVSVSRTYPGRLRSCSGSTRSRCKTSTLGGRLHDIGKLAIRLEDLNKPGPLTDEEFARMKLHPVTGERLLRTLPNAKSILAAVGAHHERLDGSGYPRGLVGDEIPLIARIVAVADAYDAMTSDRAYRKAMSHRDALVELQRCAGTHYDLTVIEALQLACTDDGPFDGEVSPRVTTDATAF